MWQSRSRLNSARTVSESSEGCGTGMEMEMGEDFPLAGSLKRRRHREDSAYVSQRDSMSGGPPETPSPEMEEEDQNGYVLPGGSPERGDTIIVNLQYTNSYHLEMSSSPRRLAVLSQLFKILCLYSPSLASLCFLLLSVSFRYVAFLIASCSWEDGKVSFIRAPGRPR